MVRKCLLLLNSIWYFFITRKVIKKGRNSLLFFCKTRHVEIGNSIIVGDNSHLNRCSFLIKGKNNRIIIKDNCLLSNVRFYVTGDGNCIEIGNGVTVGTSTEFAALEGTIIRIGDDCMFAHDIKVRTSDSHSIVDEQGERINKSGDISIGKHCWIGMQALILKRSSMGDNSVLAARSILNKNFQESGCIIGGSPAKILKTNINWDRRKI